MLLGLIDVENQTAEVHWNDRAVGLLSGIVVDQPYYHGVWSPIADAEFEQAFRDMQDRIAPDGLGVIPVTLRSPDGSRCAPVLAFIRPAPEVAPAPHFRFGSENMTAHIIKRPTGSSVLRDCEQCGCPISEHRLSLVPAATRCFECQTEVERARGKQESRTLASGKKRWWRWW